MFRSPKIREFLRPFHRAYLRYMAGVVLRRASLIDIPTITWRALSRRARLTRHRRVHPFSGVSDLHVRSLDERPLPLQVDGDYIGEVHEATFESRPSAMLVVA